MKCCWKFGEGEIRVCKGGKPPTEVRFNCCSVLVITEITTSVSTHQNGKEIENCRKDITENLNKKIEGRFISRHSNTVSFLVEFVWTAEN